MKVAIKLSYDGSRFLGSQSQPNAMGVEDALRMALARVGISSGLVMSSRTDKGVHSLGQVAGVIAGECWQGREEWLKAQLNRHLPLSVRVVWLRKVDDEFHARFSARARSYRYFISTSQPSAFEGAYYSYFKELSKFDFKRANELLKLFCGTHDFLAYMKAGSETKSSVRTIYQARCYPYKNTIVISLRANGFLRSQVRLIVSALLKALKMPPQQATKAIANSLYNAKALTRMPAPAQGLYLVRVHYFGFGI